MIGPKKRCQICWDTWRDERCGSPEDLPPETWSTDGQEDFIRSHVIARSASTAAGPPEEGKVPVSQYRRAVRSGMLSDHTLSSLIKENKALRARVEELEEDLADTKLVYERMGDGQPSDVWRSPNGGTDWERVPTDVQRTDEGQ
jgi:hypothetical protein